MYDCIIIGAGPSGMMCAVIASQNGKKTLLIEKNNVLGKKMQITGGNRCNITNLKDNDSFINNLPTRNGRFLYSSLQNFGPFNIYKYFTNLGIKLKEENNNRIFPKSNDANDFINALEKELNKYNVDIKLNTEVINIDKDNHFIITTNKAKYHAKNIVIATGGLSYPHTGSTGFGYKIAKKFNHTITELFPTESPIISHDKIINSKKLQGLSFPKIKISLIDNNNKITKSFIDDLIITHFGLSGPAALKLSQFVYQYLKNKNEAKLEIDFLPLIKNEEIIQIIKNNPKSKFLTILKQYLPKRLLNFIFCQLNLSENLKVCETSNKTIFDVISLIKKFALTVHGVKPITVAFVTGGGVSIKEINPKTMESKIIPGLYFIGEILDLHGYTGGYNLTIALSTGYTAGLNLK